jgi:hypothetical protein
VFCFDVGYLSSAGSPTNFGIPTVSGTTSLNPWTNTHLRTLCIALSCLPENINTKRA